MSAANLGSLTREDQQFVPPRSILSQVDVKRGLEKISGVGFVLKTERTEEDGGGEEERCVSPRQGMVGRRAFRFFKAPVEIGIEIFAN